MARQTAQAPLTLALKPLGGGGEQQLAFHVRGPSAAGNAWFLVPCLDPAGEPAQVAAAVQGVGPDGSAGEKWQNCTCCPAEGTGFADLGTGQDLVTWLGCHMTGEPNASPFPDQTEKTETAGLLYGNCGTSLGSATQACRAGTWERAAENNHKLVARAHGDSIGRQQVIALREEEEGGLLCSTAERGREQWMRQEAECLDASLHPPSLQRSAVMEGWRD